MIQQRQARRSRSTPVRYPALGFALGAAIIAAVGCGGRQAGGPEPRTSPRETVTTFMSAVADSNLTKMASLWGSSKGSAAATGEPVDYERRVVLMQSYLRHDDYRIVTATQNAGHWEGQVELRRQACTWIVPFTAVEAESGGWIINNIDLTRAGNPVRPCDPTAPRKPSPGN